MPISPGLHEVLSQTTFVREGSGCLRYAQRTGTSTLTEPRDYELHPSDFRILTEREYRTAGNRFGLRIFDDYFSWITHRSVGGHHVAIQMLDRDQQVNHWPTEVIGAKRIVVDIALSEQMYMRMRPFIPGVQYPAYRLQLVNRQSGSRVHHDSFRLQDTHEGARPSTLIMLGRYFDPFLVKPGQTTSVAPRLFVDKPIQVSVGRYFFNGSSLFAHGHAPVPYKIESLMQVNDDQTLQNHWRQQMPHDLAGGVWEPTGADAAAVCGTAYEIVRDEHVVTTNIEGFEGCRTVRMPTSFCFHQPTLNLSIGEDTIPAVVAGLEENIAMLIREIVDDNDGIFDFAKLQGQ